jgi:hypothetical protein
MIKIQVLKKKMKNPKKTNKNILISHIIKMREISETEGEEEVEEIIEEEELEEAKKEKVTNNKINIIIKMNFIKNILTEEEET